ncbi:hypothetical protein [Thiomonas bhubaneswarensis]|uniref:DUF2189 domain-containing protein n=1 Tax=Thiomonas bhubaneswarensis TaxID=339866 RepID=A0A0K6HXZ9_9BURK|nr:hypothetical protein [Thiomonas bhubaneswarensis]CUA95701.1 hypothetical protein Ga0061069_103210 [Thiomonas bhubaneswarensis]
MTSQDLVVAEPSFRLVAAGYGLRWWGEGWRSFTQAPLPWVGLALALLVLLWLIGELPLGGVLSQWLSLPLLAFGVIFAALLRQRATRAREITPPGMPLEPQNEGALNASAKAWSGRIGPLLLASLLVLAIGGVVGAIIVMGLGALFGLGLASMGALAKMMTPGMGMAAGMGAMAGSVLTLLLLVLLALYLFSVAFWFVNTLVAIGGVRPWDAVKLSVRAEFANLAPITLFTVLLLPISLLAMLPFGLGLLVLFPVLSGASYASYHDVFGDAAAG